MPIILARRRYDGFPGRGVPFRSTGAQRSWPVLPEAAARRTLINYHLTRCVNTPVDRQKQKRNRMSKQKKVEKIIDIALTEDLTEYVKLLKVLKKRLPFFGGTRRIAAALLKEHLGDISKLELNLDIAGVRTDTGKVVFEDIKDGKARLFINIGKSHHVSPGDLIREIVKRSGIDGKLVGKIDIHATYSFIEVPEQYAEIVLISLDKTKMKGIPVVVEPAKRRGKKDD